MKKFIIILILAFIANVALPQSFSVGPKLGINIGSPIPFGNIPEGAGGTPIIGRNIGLVFDFELNDNFGIQYEITMMRKACNFYTPLDSVAYIDKIQHPFYPDIVFEVETFFNGEARGAFDNFYIEQSLIHNLKISEKLDIAFGVFSAWLQHSKTTATGKGRVGFNPEEIEESLDYASYMRTWDYGLKAGMQYELRKQIDINVRISYGLESVFTDNFNLFQYPINNTFLEMAVCYKLFPAVINANLKPKSN
jgi:hypothetical protein